jgi:hypothetical protein
VLAGHAIPREKYMPKTFAECAEEDARVCKHCFKNYQITSEHARNKRLQELVADKFRIEGRLDNVGRNGLTRRATQSKRGYL